MRTIVYHSEDKLYINLTNKCDNRCEFCIRNHSSEMFGYKLWLDQEPTVKEIIEELKKIDFSKYIEVVYCGFGEPTYKIDVIKEVSKFLKQQNITIRINTNGHGNLINGRDISKDLVDSVDIINVSLNEVGEDAYDAICHSMYGKSGYSAMLDFAKLCIDNGGDVVFSVVDCIPKDSIEKAKKLAKSMGARLRIREMT